MILNLYTDEPSYEEVNLPDYVPKTTYVGGVSPFRGYVPKTKPVHTPPPYLSRQTVAYISQCPQGVTAAEVAAHLKCRVSSVAQALIRAWRAGRVQRSRVQRPGKIPEHAYYPLGAALMPVQTTVEIVYAYVAAHPGKTSTEIGDALGMPTAWSTLSHLKRVHRIRTEGPLRKSEFYVVSKLGEPLRHNAEITGLSG